MATSAGISSRLRSRLYNAEQAALLTADSDSGEEMIRIGDEEGDSSVEEDEDSDSTSDDVGDSRSRGRGRGRGPGHSSSVNRQRPTADLFQWTPYHTGDPYEPNWLCDYRRRRGILVDTTNFKPVDYFKLFFPDEVFELMRTQSNLYREQMLTEDVAHLPHARLINMKPIEDGEMQAFVALQIAMGLCNKPAISDYWSTYWLTHLKFCDVMARNRYENLNYALHFCNNQDRIPAGNEGYDPLFKVRPLLNIVDPLYLQAFCPGRDLSLDETMIKFKGRIFFDNSTQLSQLDLE